MSPDASDSARAREVLEALLTPLRDAPFRIEEAREESPASPPSTTQRVSAELQLATLVWDAGEQESARTAVTELTSRLGDTTAHQAHRDEVARWLEEHPLP